jgi:hypothetical protein
VFGQILDGLSNDFELPQRPILPHPVGHEGVAKAGAVLGDVV